MLGGTHAFNQELRRPLLYVPVGERRVTELMALHQKSHVTPGSMETYWAEARAYSCEGRALASREATSPSHH